VPYWWDGDISERYWVEIRYVEGIGEELRCPVTDESGQPNAWYDLVESVNTGDVVYHWNAEQHRFVGRSEVAQPVLISGGQRTVELANFVPIRATVDLALVRQHEQDLTALRDTLREENPGEALYLPFQYRSDGLRMMSNYFAKLPKTVVDLFFDETGVGEGSAAPPPGDEGPTGPTDTPPARYRFLEPFQPRQDSWYQVNVSGGLQRRSRKHETLVNNFAHWLSDNGVTGVGRNAVVDLGVLQPPVVIEAKIVGSTWAPAIRAAVGQLYEYRFFQVTNPQAALVFLADQPVPTVWVEYLDRDRQIGSAWPNSTGFSLTALAQAALGL